MIEATEGVMEVVMEKVKKKSGLGRKRANRMNKHNGR